MKQKKWLAKDIHAGMRLAPRHNPTWLHTLVELDTVENSRHGEHRYHMINVAGGMHSASEAEEIAEYLNTHNLVKWLVRFDAYEVDGIGGMAAGVEVDEVVPDSEARYWTLFGHQVIGGRICIGDFESREEAEAMAQQLNGGNFSYEC